jgi:hypothetical protein
MMMKLLLQDKADAVTDQEHEMMMLAALLHY